MAQGLRYEQAFAIIVSALPHQSLALAPSSMKIPHMNPSRLFALCLCLIAFAVRAEPGPVETTPELENLNSLIKANGGDTQAK